ncbi:MAG: hypothetical protein ACTSV5_06420 [Promethearchaeota archaeon]
MIDIIEEQYNEIIETFPEIEFIVNTKYHLRYQVKNDVFLELNFKNYPKKPKAKLTNYKGKRFKLQRIVSSLRDWNDLPPLSIVELLKEIFLLIESMESNQILIQKDFLYGLMDICRTQHPHKLVGLLSVKKGLVSEYVLPSKSCTDPETNFEIFRPTCSVPLDVSNEGTFISRPSGDLSSNEELNLIFKKRRFTLLLGYPYESIDCIKCFDTNGNTLDVVLKE